MNCFIYYFYDIVLKSFGQHIFIYFLGKSLSSQQKWFPVFSFHLDLVLGGSQGSLLRACRATGGVFGCSLVSGSGTLQTVCSEGYSTVSDLTVEMGCSLSPPRALCLILLTRGREGGHSSLCVFCNLPPSPLHTRILSTNYWIRTH